ncbi:hypothetical protein PENTCL1PPCAC_14867, partial [Pristionchus entomophagus]
PSLVHCALLGCLHVGGVRACIRMTPTDPGIPATEPVPECKKCMAALVQYKAQAGTWQTPMGTIDNSGTCSKMTNFCTAPQPTPMLLDTNNNDPQSCGNPCEITCKVSATGTPYWTDGVNRNYEYMIGSAACA